MSCKCCPKKRCGCKKAFSDAFIRSIMRKIELGNSAAGTLADAQAYADLFCEDGCHQANLGTPACGPSAVLAVATGAQSVLATLTFTNLVITRTVNPDCSVNVNVFRNASVTLVSDPGTEHLSYGVNQMTIDASCCLKYEAFVDLFPQCPCPPT